MHVTLRTALAAVVLYALATSAAGAAGTDSGAAHGKALFMQNGCYTCHGTAGQGNRFSGPKIAPNPVPYAVFLRQLRTPANDMPPYAASVLSDADASAIYAYLRSIPAGKPPAGIPLLKDVKPANGGTR